jgi:hypothetical protein
LLPLPFSLHVPAILSFELLWISQHPLLLWVYELSILSNSPSISLLDQPLYLLSHVDIDIILWKY